MSKKFKEQLTLLSKLTPFTVPFPAPLTGVTVMLKLSHVLSVMLASEILYTVVVTPHSSSARNPSKMLLTFTQ